MHLHATSYRTELYWDVKVTVELGKMINNEVVLKKWWPRMIRIKVIHKYSAVENEA